MNRKGGKGNLIFTLFPKQNNLSSKDLPLKSPTLLPYFITNPADLRDCSYNALFINLLQPPCRLLPDLLVLYIRRSM